MRVSLLSIFAVMAAAATMACVAVHCSSEGPSETPSSYLESVQHSKFFRSMTHDSYIRSNLWKLVSEKYLQLRIHNRNKRYKNASIESSLRGNIFSHQYKGDRDVIDYTAKVQRHENDRMQHSNRDSIDYTPKVQRHESDRMRQQHVFDPALYLRENNISSAQETVEGTNSDEDSEDGLSAQLWNESQMKQVVEGAHIAVYWPKYKRYYEAEVLKVKDQDEHDTPQPSPSTQQPRKEFLVQYLDDDFMSWIDPHRDTFHIISNGNDKTEAHGWTQVNMKDLLAAARVQIQDLQPQPQVQQMQ